MKQQQHQHNNISTARMRHEQDVFSSYNYYYQINRETLQEKKDANFESFLKILFFFFFRKH